MTDDAPKAETQSIPSSVKNRNKSYNINESADKIRLKTQLKRGSGTRDQDIIEVKIKGDDPEEAVEKLNTTLELLTETADVARRTQPGGSDE